MRVFLDTNVLVSAFTTRGLCADLLRLALAEQELLSAEIVLQELRRVLSERFRLPTPVILGITELLRSQSVVVSKPEKSAITGVRDPDDEWVITSALLAPADVLVTGDKDLLVLKSVKSMLILNPRGFWLHLKTGQS